MYRVHNYWSANTKIQAVFSCSFNFLRTCLYYTIMIIHIHAYPTSGKLYMKYKIIKLERMRSARCRESIVFEWASRKSIAKDYLAKSVISTMHLAYGRATYTY